MKIDWNQVIGPVVSTILIPELLAFISKFRDANGVDPTVAQVREALALNVAEGLSLWDAWFMSHPK